MKRAQGLYRKLSSGNTWTLGNLRRRRESGRESIWRNSQWTYPKSEERNKYINSKNLKVAQWYRISLPMQQTLAWSLGQEDHLKEEMATHSIILAWKIHGQRSLVAVVHGVTQGSDTTENTHTHRPPTMLHLKRPILTCYNRAVKNHRQRENLKSRRRKARFTQGLG